MKSTPTTARSRAVLIPGIAVLALIGALVLALPRTSADAAPAPSVVQHDGHDAAASQAPKPPKTAAALALHDGMRQLWEDHIAWTRLAIVTFAAGTDGFPTTAERLLRNQADIGNAIKPFYGDAAGDQLTVLLRDHITIAVEVLQAAKVGDTTAFDQANARWYANAEDIADFLAAANPRSWPQDAMRTGMRAHLDQTLAEAAHELGGDYAASIADYDVVHSHILALADTLSAGIIAQFPRRFR